MWGQDVKLVSHIYDIAPGAAHAELSRPPSSPPPPYLHPYVHPSRQLEASRLRETLGNGHPDTLKAITALAYQLKLHGGRTVEACSLYSEVLRARRVLLGSMHPMTLTSINNLAVARWAIGSLSPTSITLAQPRVHAPAPCPCPYPCLPPLSCLCTPLISVLCLLPPHTYTTPTLHPHPHTQVRSGGPCECDEALPRGAQGEADRAWP